MIEHPGLLVPHFRNDLLMMYPSINKLKGISEHLLRADNGLYVCNLDSRWGTGADNGF